MLCFLLIILSIVAIYYMFIKPALYWKSLGVKQFGLIRHIYVNWFMLFKKQSAATLTMELYNAFSNERYYGFHQLNYPTLIIKDLDLLKQIMIKEFDSFADHRFILPKEADILFLGNLVTLKGEEWRNMRSILSPTFTSNKMKFLFQLMNDYGQKFIKHFTDRKEDLIEIEMQDVITKFCSDVVASTTFGIEVNTFEDPNNDFYVNGRTLTNFLTFGKQIKFILCLAYPTLYRLLNLRFLDEKEANFFANLVADSIKQREEKGIVRPDMIHLMMQAKAECEKISQTENHTKKVTYDDIVSHAVTFFFAGFDPIARLICFSSHELAENPDIQQKLRDEIKTTLKKCNGKLTYEALMGMKYIDMVVSETLRKYPTQVATDRVCTKPFTIEPQNPDEEPLLVPLGTGITVATFGIHRDPQYFPNPEKFDPERFSDENKTTIPPYAYQPFGLGPRNCIGNRFALMEAKIALFYILDKFELVPVKKTTIPLVLLKDMFSLSAEGGFWMGLKRLEQNEDSK